MGKTVASMPKEMLEPEVEDFDRLDQRFGLIDHRNTETGCEIQKGPTLTGATTSPQGFLG